MRVWSIFKLVLINHKRVEILYSRDIKFEILTLILELDRQSFVVHYLGSEISVGQMMYWLGDDEKLVFNNCLFVKVWCGLIPTPSECISLWRALINMTGWICWYERLNCKRLRYRFAWSWRWILLSNFARNDTFKKWGGGSFAGPVEFWGMLVVLRLGLMKFFLLISKTYSFQLKRFIYLFILRKQLFSLIMKRV